MQLYTIRLFDRLPVSLYQVYISVEYFVCLSFQLHTAVVDFDSILYAIYYLCVSLSLSIQSLAGQRSLNIHIIAVTINKSL